MGRKEDAGVGVQLCLKLAGRPTISKSWKASISSSASVLLDWMVLKSLSEPEIVYGHYNECLRSLRR